MTYWGYNDNYGQLLQVYALSSYLKSLGHHVEVIKYDHMNDTTLKRSLLNRLFTMAHKPSWLIKGITERIIDKVLPGKTNKDCPCTTSFLSFKEKYLNWTQYYPTFNSLMKNPPQADVYICGSDMIWGETAFRPNPFFLDFGKAKLIAYAPSFGRKTITRPYANYIKSLINRFAAISVREDSGVKICNTLGRPDTICVPDPTLLLDQRDYSTLEKPYSVKSPYVFLYIIGANGQSYVPEIIKQARLKNFDILYRSAQGGKDDGFNKVYPSPGEWLYLIKNSAYVVTNSFHGVIFSIIYRKNFVYIPTKGKMSSANERIYSILSKLNITGRIYSGGIFFNDDMSYDKNFENLLSRFINKGKSFLDENLI